MNQEFQNDITNIICKVNETISPTAIFIFGSVANGTEQKGSDIDICIITRIGNVRKLDLIRQIRRDLREIVDKPMDILIYDEEEFEARAKLSSTFEYKIKQEGVKVA